MKTLIEATKFENPIKAGEEYINSFGRKGFTYVVYGSKVSIYKNGKHKGFL